MKMIEEGKEHPPERNQNLPSDTAITFHALKLFHCVKNIKHKGFCPLLAGVIVYHPSGKQGNYWHGEAIVLKHLMDLFLSLKLI